MSRLRPMLPDGVSTRQALAQWTRVDLAEGARLDLEATALGEDLCVYVHSGVIDMRYGGRHELSHSRGFVFGLYPRVLIDKQPSFHALRDSTVLVGSRAGLLEQIAPTSSKQANRQATLNTELEDARRRRNELRDEREGHIEADLHTRKPLIARAVANIWTLKRGPTERVSSRFVPYATMVTHHTFTDVHREGTDKRIDYEQVGLWAAGVFLGRPWTPFYSIRSWATTPAAVALGREVTDLPIQLCHINTRMPGGKTERTVYTQGGRGMVLCKRHRERKEPMPRKVILDYLPFRCVSLREEPQRSGAKSQRRHVWTTIECWDAHFEPWPHPEPVRMKTPRGWESFEVGQAYSLEAWVRIVPGPVRAATPLERRVAWPPLPRLFREA